MEWEVEWSGRRDSNSQPTAWKAVTLPLSYSRSREGVNSFYYWEPLLSSITLAVWKMMYMSSDRLRCFR